MQNARADMSNMIRARQKTPKVFLKATKQWQILSLYGL